MIAENGHRDMVHQHCYDEGSIYDDTLVKIGHSIGNRQR